MAYILLALGMAMSLAGVAAMATGYPMIEIERGWAMVITGAVLLSGGLVVVALGLVVRHLIGLRGILAAGTALPFAADAPVPQPVVVPTPLMPTQAAMPAATVPWDAVPEPRPALPRASAAPFAAAPALAAVVPAGAAALAAGALHAYAPTPEAPVAPEPHVPATQVPEAQVPETHVPETHVPETYVPEVHAAEPSAHDTHAVASPEVATHEPAEPAVESPATQPDHRKSEDWLDQAFSAFDYEMTNGHPPAAPQADPEVHRAAPVAHDIEPPRAAEPALEGETLHVAETSDELHVRAPASPEPHAHKPAVPHPSDEVHAGAEAHEPAIEAPETAPAEPAADLAVIGRYDSEGTSYVMYSDGSIEAQSESGVYRFGSMAELKAFIEG